MMTFSVVLAYMLMTLLSDAAMTAAWSVATRMPLKVAGTTLPGSTITSSLKFRSQSTELGMPSPSSSLLLRMPQLTVAPAVTTRPEQVLLDWTQPDCAASETPYVPGVTS